mmetsp:Transcript_40197/g.54663  ORF Transcript_40197/g.54663 Transcript_40197/m.54663 type:complete len:290 (-) Transcript_40197:623-1492(-)
MVETACGSKHGCHPVDLLGIRVFIGHDFFYCGTQAKDSRLGFGDYQRGALDTVHAKIYNREGTDGAILRSEGSVLRTFDLGTDAVRQVLETHRTNVLEDGGHETIAHPRNHVHITSVIHTDGGAQPAGVNVRHRLHGKGRCLNEQVVQGQGVIPECCVEFAPHGQNGVKLDFDAEIVVRNLLLGLRQAGGDLAGFFRHGVVHEAVASDSRRRGCSDDSCLGDGSLDGDGSRGETNNVRGDHASLWARSGNPADVIASLFRKFPGQRRGKDALAGRSRCNRNSGRRSSCW